jgi:hypothetical protein
VARAGSDALGEGPSRLVARLFVPRVCVIQRPIDLGASPMEKQSQIGGIGPLELLSARFNIQPARRAGMRLAAWANEHSTRHDGWKEAGVDKVIQVGPNADRGGRNRVQAIMNRWSGSGVDELRPQFDASSVKNQTHHLVGEDLVFDVAELKMNAAAGAPSSPLTPPDVHGLGRTSRQDVALDESAQLCSDGRLRDRKVAIAAAAADRKSHPTTHADGRPAKLHTRFTCRSRPTVQIAGPEAGGPRPTHRCSGRR